MRVARVATVYACASMAVPQYCFVDSAQPAASQVPSRVVYTMRYIGAGEKESLTLFRKNDTIWRVVQAADTVRLITDEGHVKAWEVTKCGDSMAIRYSNVARMQQAAPQMAAEIMAAEDLAGLGDHPLLILPLMSSMQTGVGAFSISPYAGEVVSELRATEWAHCSSEELEKTCKVLAICLLYTQVFYGTMDEVNQENPPIARCLHKDIKLNNICYNRRFGLFHLIDYGGFSDTDKTRWVDVRDMRYLPREMARYHPGRRQYAAQFTQGLLSATNHTTDLYLTGLALVHMFLGHMPAEIDRHLYQEEDEYLEAVWRFNWAECRELNSMPQKMQEFLLWLLAPTPDKRPQNAEEAVRHDWLLGAYVQVGRSLKNAIAPWEKMMQRLRQLVGGSSCSCSSISSCGACVQEGTTLQDCSSCADMAANAQAAGSLSCSTPSFRPSCEHRSYLDSPVTSSDSSTGRDDSVSAEDNCAVAGAGSKSHSDAQCSPASDAAAAAAAASRGGSTTIFPSAEALVIEGPASIRCRHCDVASNGCCCSAEGASAGVTVSTQTAGLDSGSELHVMLLMVSESVVSAEASTLEAEVPSSLGPGTCGQLTSGLGMHTSNVGLQECSMNHSVCLHNEAPHHHHQQQQQQCALDLQAAEQKKMQHLVASAASGCRHTDECSRCSGSGNNSSSTGSETLERAVKLQLKHAFGLMACVLSGLQHCTHR